MSIINLTQAISTTAQIRKRRQSIALSGGCFDILHIGHIRFLKEAKKMGDILMVLLESDEKVKKLKGINRPLFMQKERAEVLSAISFVDYVILLPFMKTDKGYDDLVFLLKPSAIAVTENDAYLSRKKIQAEKIAAKINIVPLTKTYSTSRLAKLLGIE